jgi:hypothetical protein
MILSVIKQNLKNIDYAWDNPQTYLVFVPGLSLAIQKIQIATVLPLKTENLFKSLQKHWKPECKENLTLLMQENNERSKKFAAICKWHLTGSLVQMLVSAVAVKFFAAPLLSIFLMISAYELGDTFVKALTNQMTIIETYSDGSIKRMKSSYISLPSF